MNNIFKKLLLKINEERESFDMLVSADNTLGLNVLSDDIINFLEFVPKTNLIKAPIIGNVIITEGDILSVLKIIHDLANNEGEYILFINNDNLGTITYLINRVNAVYEEEGLKLSIKIDYSDNYNAYVDTMVSIIGSKDFVETSKVDFAKANCISL